MANPLLPLWPRPGITETLEWLTDVRIFEDGTEERIEKRTAPLQSISYDYFVPFMLRAQIANLVYGGRDQQWYVPMWPQVQEIGAISAGASTVECETRYSELRPGGFAVIWESPGNYQVVEINDIEDDDTISLVGTTQAFTSAWLMPCRLGSLIGNPARQFNGRASVLSLAFEIDDRLQLEPDAPEQYLGEDIYYEPGLLEGGFTQEQIAARIDVFDEGLGPITYASPWLNKRVGRIHRLMGETPDQTWAMREFVHRRCGRSRPFWQPSFESDFRVASTGAITTTLDVQDDDYRAFAAKRAHIAVETADGWLPRAITNRTDQGSGVTRLTLSSSLAINASAIKRVCFLGLKRLDTDRIEINWPAVQIGKCALNTVEFQP